MSCWRYFFGHSFCHSQAHGVCPLLSFLAASGKPSYEFRCRPYYPGYDSSSDEEMARYGSEEEEEEEADDEDEEDEKEPDEGKLFRQV